jgi:hypothetical protein
VVSSDHSPAPPADKLVEEGDFLRAWGGISSLQFSLPATWTKMSKLGMDLVKLAGEWEGNNMRLTEKVCFTRALLPPRLAVCLAKDAVFPKAPDERWIF